MPTLCELQDRFLRGILDGEAANAKSLVLAQGLDPLERLAIYANNASANFLESLRFSFPAVRRLVGEDYFSQCVRQYHRRHPSRSGDLQHTGSAFSDFLGELHGNDQFAYLQDVARLEWLYQESLIASDHAPLDFGRLAAVEPAQYDDLQFKLHPAAHLFASPYPALEIWRANVDGEADPKEIDLTQGSDRLGLTRTRGRIEFLHLGPGE